MLLDGVDILLVAPGLKEGTHEGFLEAMRSTPETAAIPVLTFSDALKMALVDELSAGGFLARPFRGACGADRNLPRKSCCELQASGGRLRGACRPSGCCITGLCKLSS